MKILIILAIMLMVTIPQLSLAGSQTGKVLNIRVSSKTIGNPTHILLEGAWSNKPTCAVAWWAIDTDTVAGKSLLSILLTAYSTGKEITLWGTGQCDLRGDMETAFQAGL